jgi:hypothetical protein
MGTDGPHRDRRESPNGQVAGSRSATWFDRTRPGAWLDEYFIVTGRSIATTAAVSAVGGLGFGVLLFLGALL